MPDIVRSNASGNQVVTDKNLKVLGKFIVPTGVSPTFNGGTAETGALFISTSGRLSIYAQGQWISYAKLSEAGGGGGGGGNVQSNWNTSDPDDPSYILNKPTLFSGSYNDLTNKPTLFSGAYADLTGKPTIPTATSQLTNDSGYLTSVPAQSFASLTGKPTTLSGYGITDAYPLTGNPSGFLTGITSGQVTTALGYTPYNSTNPSGYITSAALSGYATTSYADGKVAQTITNGVTTSAPSQDAVYDALQLKLDKTALGTTTVETFTYTSGAQTFTLSQVPSFIWSVTVNGASLNTALDITTDQNVPNFTIGNGNILTNGDQIVITYVYGTFIPVTDIINDTVTSSSYTWSSNKINTTKQDTLVSGTTIKTINSTSLLGSGNISVQAPISLTTTGTSGAATLVGNTLNIPQYSGGGTTYTFGTGLTNTSGTITANLATGIAGGQSVIGGTASGNNLTLSSTSNTTKGKILFGTSAYDEINNRLGVGVASPTYSLDISGMGRFVYNDSSFNNGLLVKNSNVGANNVTGIALLNRSDTAVGAMQYVHSDFTAPQLANTVLFVSIGTQKLGFQANASSSGGGANVSGQDIYFSRYSGAQYDIFIKGTSGNVGIQNSSPTARLHISAGTAVANTAPLKLTPGTNLTNPENGAFEYDGTNLYFTTGSGRKTVTLT